MVATEAAGGIKASGREATGLGWVLKGVRLPFIWPFQNMAIMKVTGKGLSLFSPSFKITSDWRVQCRFQSVIEIPHVKIAGAFFSEAFTARLGLIA